MELPRPVAVVVAALWLWGSPASAADQWRRLTTEHFTVIGNTPASSLRDLGQTLESFRDTITQVLPNAAAGSAGETVVILFKDEGTFKPYKPANVDPDRVGGLFRRNEDVTFLALNAHNLTWALQSTLGGYSQSMVADTVGPTPAWVMLGTSEMYRTFQQHGSGKAALIGVPDNNVVATLRRGRLMPLPDLLAGRPPNPGLQPGSPERGLLTAEAWALVHFLTLGSNDRRSQFREYLAHVRTGDREGALAKLGNLSDLELELSRYIQQAAFPAVQVTFETEAVGTHGREPELLDPAEAEAYLSGLLATTGDAAAARSRLQKVLKSKPDAPRAALALGLVELRSNNAEGAMPLLKRAASLLPDDAFAQSAYGRALASRLYQPGTLARTENVVEARQVLTRAVELDAQSPSALASLGRTYLYEPPDPAKAIGYLRQAIILAPARQDYQLSLADALLRTADYGGATSILGPLLARGYSQPIRDAARAQLATVNDRKAGLAPAGMPAPLPVRLNGTGQPPRKTKDVRPIYPADAQSKRVQGMVVVETTIDPTGKIASARVVRSIPLLDEAALAAVRQWEFTPTTVDGVAVPVIMTVTVNFSLDGAAAPPPDAALARTAPWPIAPDPPPPGVFNPGDGVTMPRVLKEVKPAYTRAALQAKVQGTVTVRCVVGPDGTVSNIAVLQSLDRTYGLDKEAIKAAGQWRFAPGTRDGVPVPVQVTIALSFTLE